MPANATWPDELLARTKALYESGKHSMAQIARAIGGVKSRNAVIGIAKRRGWVNPSPKKGGTKPRERRPRQIRIGGPNWARTVAPTIIEQPEELPKPENFLGLTIQQLASGQCRFPDGEGPFFFCGQPAQGGSSYCAYHHRICWQKPDRRPDRRFVSRQNF